MTKLADTKRFGVTTDGWTHETTTTPYITVTLHYINEVGLQLLSVLCEYLAFVLVQYTYFVNCRITSGVKTTKQTDW